MLLLWLILLPLLGGVACWLSERVSAELPRRVALLVTGATLLLALVLWCSGNYSAIGATYPQWQAEFSVNWIERFGIRFHLALDGLSILMVVLTSLMGVIAVLASYREETSYNRPGLFYFCLSMTVAGVMGVFTAIDLFFFFFFWELMLIPMYFMIAVWGNPHSSQGKRFNGATKFFIYTQASGLILLIAILSLVLLQYQANGIWSFAYADLLHFATTGGVSSVTLMAVMIGFFIAFAVKMPIIPLHGWLADAHEQAPTAGSIDITGLLLKTAAYGMLRFSIPFFPAASAEFAPIAMGLGLFGLFYGAWLAFGQTNIKRLIAYTSVSHMGLVTIAIYSGSLLAYQGAVVQMVAHGISAAGLFVVCGILYSRLKTFDMREMGGLWGQIRYLPAFSLL
ncbi:MAG: NADH-quinone oxidoreductase subunit M, partial [Saezia sp.]